VAVVVVLLLGLALAAPTAADALDTAWRT